MPGNDQNNTPEYCMMCLRRESDSVKLIHMPGNLTVCTDCLQRSMDMMSNSEFLRGIQIPGGVDPRTILNEMYEHPERFEGFGLNFGGNDQGGSGAGAPGGDGSGNVIGTGTPGGDGSGNGTGTPGGDGSGNGTGTGMPGGNGSGDGSSSGSSGTAPKKEPGEAETPSVIILPDGQNPVREGTGGEGQIPVAPVPGNGQPGGNNGQIPGSGQPGGNNGQIPGSGQPGGNGQIPGGSNQPGGRTISIFNLGSLFSPPPNARREPKPKEKKEGEGNSILDLKQVPPPHKIRAMLDEYVIGQDHAKKVLSVAVYNHYKRLFTNTMDEIRIEKSNVLMLGPTGCGKTYLVQTLAKVLDVPLAISDATSLTEAGYIGDDIESVVSKLLMAAGDDVERCEQGIVFIDEIDKLAKKRNTNQRDVSGESVQQGLLSLLEGSTIEVPVGASSKNAMVPMETINTRNILFICGGAFPGLEDIIRERLNKTASMGFGAQLQDAYEKDPDILTQVRPEDLRKFGMIPEFIGRLPVICPLRSMTKEMLVSIMTDPKNAILRQYQKLLELDEVKLEFDDSALDAIAEKALERETGARGLRAVIEDFMLDIMYEIPKDDNIGTVRITGDYIRGQGGPVISMRGAG